MKSKILILVVFVAVATLSFSFVTTNNTTKKVANETTINSNQSAPAGGFIAEDKF